MRECTVRSADKVRRKRWRVKKSESLKVGLGGSGSAGAMCSSVSILRVES